MYNHAHHSPANTPGLAALDKAVQARLQEATAARISARCLRSAAKPGVLLDILEIVVRSEFAANQPAERKQGDREKDEHGEPVLDRRWNCWTAAHDSILTSAIARVTAAAFALFGSYCNARVRAESPHWLYRADKHLCNQHMIERRLFALCFVEFNDLERWSMAAGRLFRLP